MVDAEVLLVLVSVVVAVEVLESVVVLVVVLVLPSELLPQAVNPATKTRLAKAK